MISTTPYSGLMAIWRWKSVRNGRYQLECSTTSQDDPLIDHLYMNPHNVPYVVPPGCYLLVWQESFYVATKFGRCRRTSWRRPQLFHGLVTIAPVEQPSDVPVLCREFQDWLQNPLRTYLARRNLIP